MRRVRDLASSLLAPTVLKALFGRNVAIVGIPVLMPVTSLTLLNRG